MKYLFVLLLTLLFLNPSAADAQSWGGIIGAYADQTAYCGTRDTPGPRTFYVMQKFSVGSTGARFRIEFSPGFTGTLVSVTAPAAEVTGDVLTGASAVYTDGCRTGTFVILELGMMLYGTSPACSWVRAVAHPLSVDGKLDSHDCDGTRNAADWQGTHISDDSGDYCPDLFGPVHNPPGCNPIDRPLATEKRTWGKVKALYR